MSATKRLPLCSFLTAACTVVAVSASQFVGTVYSTAGTPVQQAVIALLGTDIKATADQNGNFLISDAGNSVSMTTRTLLPAGSVASQLYTISGRRLSRAAAVARPGISLALSPANSSSIVPQVLVSRSPSTGTLVRSVPAKARAAKLAGDTILISAPGFFDRAVLLPPPDASLQPTDIGVLYVDSLSLIQRKCYPGQAVPTGEKLSIDGAQVDLFVAETLGVCALCYFSGPTSEKHVVYSWDYHPTGFGTGTCGSLLGDLCAAAASDTAPDSIKVWLYFAYLDTVVSKDPAVRLEVAAIREQAFVDGIVKLNELLGRIVSYEKDLYLCGPEGMLTVLSKDELLKIQ